MCPGFGACERFLVPRVHLVKHPVTRNYRYPSHVLQWSAHHFYCTYNFSKVSHVSTHKLNITTHALDPGDFIFLSRSGRICDIFPEEQARVGDDRTFSSSESCIKYRTYYYIKQVKAESAAFHRAETTWVCRSGSLAYISAPETVTFLSDAIVWDELSLASTGIGLHSLLPFTNSYSRMII